MNMKRYGVNVRDCNPTTRKTWLFTNLEVSTRFSTRVDLYIISLPAKIKDGQPSTLNFFREKHGFHYGLDSGSILKAIMRPVEV